MRHALGELSVEVDVVDFLTGIQAVLLDDTLLVARCSSPAETEALVIEAVHRLAAPGLVVPPLT